MSEQKTLPSHFLAQQVSRDMEAGLCPDGLVTRFPPEPNGYLHIGHAKSICLNFGLAESFGGICHLRFDDTNPEKEEDEYIASIQEDVRWLGFQWDGKVRFASDYFDFLHEAAIELINKGLAYVDSLTPDEIRQYRGDWNTPGKPSPYRERSVKENLDLFARMKAGEFNEGEAVLRARIDMTSPNMTLRDPVLYRVRKVSHHQTGDKWCIYPMYDFTHPVSDALEKVTHSICTLEFEEHRPLYDWVVEQVTLPARPHQFEFARLNLNYTVTSKRKLKQLVDEALVSGWDDPRMPTISGLRRRGYTPASIRKFCEMVGVARADSVVDMAMLEAAIRDDLNHNAPRTMGVLRPLKLIIDNWPTDKEDVLTVPVHPQREELGTRTTLLTREVYIEQEDFLPEANKKFKRLVLGDEVRLRYGYVIRAEEMVEDDQGNLIAVRCTYDPDTLSRNPEGRKVRGVIHWVSAVHSTPCEVRLYDRLFTEANPNKPDPSKSNVGQTEAGGDFLSCINPASLEVLTGCRVAPYLQQARVGESFQFERQGYFCLDAASTSGKLIFNRTVSLKEGF
jgi:glutaminyl-tRNA synthetase